jgi:hypothetical protein
VTKVSNAEDYSCSYVLTLQTRVFRWHVLI